MIVPQNLIAGSDCMSSYLSICSCNAWPYYCMWTHGHKRLHDVFILLNRRGRHHWPIKMMYSGSLASPEDVACYEECITDEIYLPSSPSPSASASPRDVPKSSSSGRVTKRGERSDQSERYACVNIFLSSMETVCNLRYVWRHSVVKNKHIDLQLKPASLRVWCAAVIVAECWGMVFCLRAAQFTETRFMSSHLICHEFLTARTDCRSRVICGSTQAPYALESHLAIVKDS